MSLPTLSAPVLRTPEHCFEAVRDFPYTPHYLELSGGSGGGTPLRVAYIDEGPRDAPVVLLMHGEPTWSYLYRTMIPPLLAAGLRVVAPDLVGFGRSDKPSAQRDYSYAHHVRLDERFGWLPSRVGAASRCFARTGARSLACAWRVRSRSALSASRWPMAVCPRARPPCRGPSNCGARLPVTRPWFPIGRIVQVPAAPRA